MSPRAPKDAEEMKTVNVVEFGCALKSVPQSDDVADQVVARLREKGVEAYAANLSRDEALQVLKGLRPVAGTDPYFDYEKGELK